MSNTPLRRSQLVVPFGVGSMIVTLDGVSLIACGLDHWYEREVMEEEVDIDEFRVEEWRLEEKLHVDHFRQPPDFRIPRNRHNDNEQKNCYLTVPFLRFPQWHYCPSCGFLYEAPLTLKGKIKCKVCEAKGYTKYMVQVRFIAICENGHIQDFPWREWVHRSARPTCDKKMRLLGTGSSSLSGQKVKCECGASRTLGSIMTAFPDGNTFLSSNLDENTPFLCPGKSPWHGTDRGCVNCGKPIRGALRNASNVYFPQVNSSIYLPRGDSSTPQNLISILEEPLFSTRIKWAKASGFEIKSSNIRGISSPLLKDFSDDQIERALDTILRKEPPELESSQIEDDPGIAFKRSEFNVLSNGIDEEQLKARLEKIEYYDPTISSFFSKIVLVEKLRETRALSGFRRVFPDNEQTQEDLKGLLWKNNTRNEANWLPACVVFGEGIFLEFNEEQLKKWLMGNQVSLEKRLQPLLQRYSLIVEERKYKERIISPKFVLMHTFSHLLINRLTFECGYSTAALRERLYFSENPKAPMAGVLIYTAAGDSEGTLGGLVRMGKPGLLEPIIRRAIENARWCSADPVCMELGSYGQGPNSTNLAACHNCALVPETTCEESNMFLDRGLVIGTFENERMGFFNLPCI